MSLNVVGILGGTFDPIHLAHLQMAQLVSRELNIKKILFVPDGDPPHKSNLASAPDRLRMAQLAVAGSPGFQVSDIEVNRKGTTYTVDTLASLRDAYPEDVFAYIVGGDTFLVVETWRNFAEVARLLHSLVVVPRTGNASDALAAHADRIRRLYGLSVVLLTAEVAPLSSTQVRLAAARQLPLNELVPESVEKYIKTHRFYREPMLTELKRTMTPARYRHTLGVEETAVRLAAQNDVDVDKARLAALLHDCAKHMGVTEMQALVDPAQADLSQGEADSRALLHAAAGCALAQSRFGVDDPDVLSAIRWHTTGKAGMSKLDKVIYLADMIEPNRKPFPGIDQIRALAEVDLDAAMAVAAKRTVAYVKSRGMPLNERTLQLLSSIEANQNREDNIDEAQ